MNNYKTNTTLIFVLIALIIVMFTSCESKEKVQSDIDILRAQRTSLQEEVRGLSSSRDYKEVEISKLNEKLKELKIYESGKTPKYILKIHLKQSHISLSISKHLKDAMNAIDFELPVDKDFYNSVSAGTRIVNEFRTGSLVLYGSFGSWEMSVTNKEIRN
jgi:cell division protein FtsB